VFQKAPKESKDKEEVKEKSPEPKKEKPAKKQQSAESPAKQDKVEKKDQKSQNNKATLVNFPLPPTNQLTLTIIFQQGQQEESRSSRQVGRGDQEQEK
jgi:hypothetical protein